MTRRRESRCAIGRRAAGLRGRLLVAALSLLLGPVGCTSPSKPGLPPGSPFADRAVAPLAWFPHGVAVGDVTSTSARFWTRTSRAARVQVQWRAAPPPTLLDRSPSASPSWQSTLVQTDPGRDLTVNVLLQPLEPGTPYQVRARVLDPVDPMPPLSAGVESDLGRFRTAPPDEASVPLTVLWGSDLGGQGHCRAGEAPYGIFDQMRARQPDLAILLGDLIYADDVCPAPPNAEGSHFVAETLEQFRGKHRYQREAAAVRQFLATVPVLVTWDDHEVRNNFSGPHETLMPIGRRALLEYWPVHAPLGEPDRLYRRIRYGRDLEVFVLDTRQYRSRNSELDGMGKTMLGEAQREWLLESLDRSRATWKIVASSVPLAIRKPGTPLASGNDSWARGGDGTGFHAELERIVQMVLARRVRNVLWIAGDVHFAQVNAYDPDGDGVPDFHEAIAGPLSAAVREAEPPVADFHPTTLYSQGGHVNFGEVRVRGTRLEVRILDEHGHIRFEHVLTARPAP